MFLRRFNLEGRLAPLLMSSAGESAGGGAGGGAPAGGAPAGGGAPAAGGAAPATLTFASDKPFHEQLPEKYRGEAAFKDIKNFDGLADSFLNAQKMIGADKVVLPKDGDDKAWGDFYNKLGRPESADKYDFGKMSDGKDYGDADKAFHSKIAPLLHEMGVSQSRLTAALPKWNAMVAEINGAPTKAAEAYAAKQQETLRSKLGAAYDETMSDAQEAIRHYAGDAGEDLLTQLNLVKDGKATGDNAALLLIFGKLGKQLREDGVIGKGGDGSGAMTPAAAQDAIKAKRADKDFMAMYNKKDHPKHGEAVAEMTALYEQAYPPQQ